MGDPWLNTGWISLSTSFFGIDQVLKPTDHWPFFSLLFIMKIIKHRPGRRPEYWAGATERPPQKKALLVGIQYERDVDGEGDAANVLRGPHRDVTDMRDLLIGAFKNCFLPMATILTHFAFKEYYLYPPQNIVVLVDTDDPNQMQPTRDNLVLYLDLLPLWFKLTLRSSRSGPSRISSRTHRLATTFSSTVSKLAPRCYQEKNPSIG
ncbi:hypothetical protein H0H81_007312 [Sphagnurus paluster]|uniref:Uncharacterized protein n=1 Tax=Sphagnurus paluster TaxID=117069 RepID=A0A9P7FVE5_9AGAR|nr:hypothetical protein H0H81_007312 [Sphagnurus paluster]